MRERSSEEVYAPLKLVCDREEGKGDFKILFFCKKAE
jgi:hypothetical protein